MSNAQAQQEVLNVDHVFSGNTAIRVKLLNFKTIDFSLREAKQTLIENENLIAEQLSSHGVKTSVIARVEKSQLAIIGQTEPGEYLALVADRSELKQQVVSLTTDVTRQIEQAIERDTQDGKATA